MGWPGENFQVPGLLEILGHCCLGSPSLPACRPGSNRVWYTAGTCLRLGLARFGEVPCKLPKAAIPTRERKEVIAVGTLHLQRKQTKVRFGGLPLGWVTSMARVKVFNAHLSRGHAFAEGRLIYLSSFYYIGHFSRTPQLATSVQGCATNWACLGKQREETAIFGVSLQSI